MSLQSLYTGISGLDSYSQAMSVISNNIANVNTVGFKGGRIAFEDILSQSLVGGSTGQIGRGVQVAAVERLFHQSTFQTTGSATDLAIDGDGFFVVAKDNETQYTRAGDFTMDEEGLLTNPQGYALQGWSLDSEGNIDSSLEDINLTTITSGPGETSEVTMHVNLDVNGTVYGAGVFDVTDPLNTSNYSSNMTIYDRMGNSHLLSIYFTRADTDTWEWNAVLPGGEVIGEAADYVAAAGTLDFTDGKLQTETTTNAFSEQYIGTTSAATLDFDFGTSIDEGGSGIDGTTQYAGAFNTKFINQDGFGMGDLLSVQIDQEGLVSGLFSNGRSQAVYQLALARFTSPWGLASIGGNLFSETLHSGPPIVGLPGSSGLGEVNSNSLELSNVDLATEFVEMIKAQQAFQANSRVITTTDQMLQEVVNLKR
jgi:flagellar hook protein FlgE